jgi:hypothetical protein
MTCRLARGGGSRNLRAVGTCRHAITSRCGEMSVMLLVRETPDTN